MAERRMFAKSIVSSARFLRMPQTSRLLYYDLGMAADDDGIVEAFTVLRTTGAAEDDLRVLASKGFIVVLNEELVSFITDWKQNNFIRPDRYHPSIYNELLVKIADGNQRCTAGIPLVDKRETEVRLGKDRLDKDRSGEDPAPPFSDKPDLQAAFDSWISYKQERRESYKETGLQQLTTQIKNNADKYGADAVASLIRDSMACNYKGIPFDRLSHNKGNSGRNHVDFMEL